MALSAVLFYTNKIYPKDIILDKNTIPDDPNERLKDKVFMSVVFTVKHFCEYKDFVVPETTFKDDLKCTKEQMEKILKSLSNKFNVTFDKHWFGTVKDLTIYVKDHTSGKSEESIVATILGLGLGVGIIGGVLYGAFKLIDWVESLSKKKSSNTNEDETVDWDTVKGEYGKLSEFILKYGKDDPFFSKEQHKTYTVDEGIAIYEMIIQRFEAFLKLPHKKADESREEYQRRLLDTMRSLKYDDPDTFYKKLPQRKPHTYIEAQYFDIAKVDKCIKMLGTIDGMYSQMEKHEESICADNDANRVWFDLRLGGEQDFSESFDSYTFGADFRSNVPRILKYVKEQLEQAKKQSK